MKEKGRRATCVAIMVAMMGSASYAVLSEPIVVDCDYRNKHWETLFTNEVTLAWQWTANASQARLDINGMSRSLSANFPLSTSNYVWRVFETAEPAVEDVFAVVLTQYSSENAVVGVTTSRLAVVKGAFGPALVKPVSDSVGWSKIKGDAVLAYDAAWTDSAANAVGARLTIAKDGGPSQTDSFGTVCGYYGWKLAHSEWGYGTFNLLLQFTGTEGQLSAVLKRSPDGSMIWMR